DPLEVVGSRKAGAVQELAVHLEFGRASLVEAVMKAARDLNDRRLIAVALVDDQNAMRRSGRVLGAPLVHAEGHGHHRRQEKRGRDDARALVAQSAGSPPGMGRALPRAIEPVVRAAGQRTAGRCGPVFATILPQTPSLW